MNLPASPPASATRLPAVEPHVAAAAVEDLTPRLRKKLDAAVERCVALPVVADGRTVSVNWGEDAVVTLVPGRSGVVVDPGAALCSCLLAPRCLHRAAVLTACPVADTDADTDVESGAESAGRDADTAGDAGAVLDEDTTAHAATTARAGAGSASRAGRVEGGAQEAGGAPAPDQESGSPRADTPTGPTAGQVAAAAEVREAAVAVLVAGVPGAGAVLQAELLRAAHTARLAGLPRAEAAALRVVRGLRAARERHDGHRLTDLASALRDLLLTSGRIAAADSDPALLGTTRRAYRQGEGLRVHGVCREPVISATGYGGVVTHLVAEDGRWFSVADVRPGGAARARGAGTATVTLGAATVNHAQLARGGLLISGATISPEGRLGSGRGVRATPVAGLPWSQGPLAALFARTLAQAADARLSSDLWGDPQAAEEANRPVGCDLVIVGAEGDRLLARELPRSEGPARTESGTGNPADSEPGTGGGEVPGDGPFPPRGPLIRLVAANPHPDLAHVENLRQLASRPGLRVRVIGRLDPDRAATMRPLAVGPVPGPGPTLRLPAEWLGRADLGYDRLRGSHLPSRDDCPPNPGTESEGGTADADPVAGSPLWRVRRLVELAVSGGRRAVAESARGGDSLAQSAPLRRAGFETAAELFVALTEEADRRARDVFGRLVDTEGDRYAWSWLAAAVHLTATERALVRASWHGRPTG
ncbi:SWIM zinc finger family protein [Streptosporangium carneum]|uniref:SWIM-type domain-containing protein n=1 Tax=Streptosporangium carneum TaxID=47481 RepID=A0A9W6IB09_9ACTN|nr:SWIM zinc finger family protein [Streptosporangium carneum]GLK14868.1 hypothetical protein GCM10017600_82810 [Streptosporangium carneum]